MKSFLLAMVLAISGTAMISPLAAQEGAVTDGGFGPAGPPGPPSEGRGGRAGGFAPAYPARVTDPDAVARGRGLYTGNHCDDCHALDTRGTERGPSLLRSQSVMRDRRGELIGPIIRAGSAGMPAIPALTDAQIGDMAEYLHSFPINSRDPARQRPSSIVTGNDAAGLVYFQNNCAACHSATGDLKGIGTKYADPRTLQGHFLSPVTTKPTVVTVSRNGTITQGRLLRIDEFDVSLITADGSHVTFARKGNAPKVTVQDPLEGHKMLLRKYTDQNIHDVTAYLVTLK